MAEAKKSPDYSSAEVVPPPLSRGAKGSRIPREVLDRFAESIKKGAFHRLAKDYEKREQANTSAVRFKKALVTEGYFKVDELTARVWGENTETAPNGQEVQAAPWVFAIGPKQASE